MHRLFWPVLAVTKSGGSGASSTGVFGADGGGALGVALSFDGVVVGKSDFGFGGEAGVVDTFCGASFDGVVGSSLPKPLPKNDPLDVAGLGKSSFAVPSDLNVLPSLKPSPRPKRPFDCCGGSWGVGVASSRCPLSGSSPLVSDDFDSNEAVLNDDLLCPNMDPPCAGVFAHEGSVEPRTGTDRNSGAHTLLAFQWSKR